MEVRDRVSVLIERGGQGMLVWVDGGQERDRMLVWVDGGQERDRMLVWVDGGINRILMYSRGT